MRPQQSDMIRSSLNLLNGPIVFIVVDEALCDALILSRDGDMRSVALAELSLKRAQELRAQWAANLRDQGSVHESKVNGLIEGLRSVRAIMGDVWKWIVEPVLQVLDLLNPVSIPSTGCSENILTMRAPEPR